MAKKAELLEQAKELGLEVSEKNTIAELEAAIKGSTKKEEPKVAKAGKHSTKGIKEAEEKQAKIERQKSGPEEEKEEAPKKPAKQVKPPRPLVERRGKNYRKAYEQIDKNKQYSFKEALELALKTNPAKFDASVELHVRLGVDPRQADQNIRGTVSLPAGTGKEVKVAVFGDVDDVKKAKSAGADIAESDEFLQRLEKEDLDFDVLVSTPMMMAKLGKYARVLGPKGLMPNPKSGTVTKDVAEAVKQAKAGKIEYRVDSNGIVHVTVGKTNFSVEDLQKNLDVIVAALKSAKPSSLKTTYVQSIYVTTTMGPSIKVVPSEI